MKNRARISVTLAIAAACIAAVSMASAEPLSIECEGFAPSGGTASCSTQFELTDARFVSIFNTHANFHAPGALGSLSMTWRDARGDVVTTLNCTGIGGPGPDGPLAGTADLASLTCTQASEKPFTYAMGIQSLTVTATEVDCTRLAQTCAFHGLLSLSDESDLY